VAAHAEALAELADPSTADAGASDILEAYRAMALATARRAERRGLYGPDLRQRLEEALAHGEDPREEL
jgi:hypothetical protein